MDRGAASRDRRRLPGPRLGRGIAIPQLLGELQAAALVLLGAGGVLYSIGAIIYARQHPDPWPRTFGFHEIFHALVIAAAAAHYVVVVGWILPAA